jgi:hypothetical protein
MPVVGSGDLLHDYRCQFGRRKRQPQQDCADAVGGRRIQQAFAKTLVDRDDHSSLFDRQGENSVIRQSRVVFDHRQDIMPCIAQRGDQQAGQILVGEQPHPVQAARRCGRLRRTASRANARQAWISAREIMG